MGPKSKQVCRKGNWGKPRKERTPKMQKNRMKMKVPEPKTNLKKSWVRMEPSV